MPEQSLSTPPGFFRRIIALVYDTFLVAALALLCTAMVIALRLAIEGPDAIAQGERAISGIWRIPTFILTILAACHFYIYFWTRNGQTLGMQAWRIRITDRDNRNISLKQAYVRCLVAMLSLFCFGLGYFWILFSREKLSWHDKLSETRLVLAPRK